LDAHAVEPGDEIEEFEPINTKLQSKRADLIRKEEDLLIELAKARRERPTEAVRIWNEGWSGGEDEFNGLLEQARAEAELELRVEKLERQAEVEAAWDSGVRGLVGLRREMPGTMAKVERAEEVGVYVQTGR
jgi:hypothetical protein